MRTKTRNDPLRSRRQVLRTLAIGRGKFHARTCRISAQQSGQPGAIRAVRFAEMVNHELGIRNIG